MTGVMLAGKWKTSRMVAHYSAGATAGCILPFPPCRITISKSRAETLHGRWS